MTFKITVSIFLRIRTPDFTITSMNPLLISEHLVRILSVPNKRKKAATRPYFHCVVSKQTAVRNGFSRILE